MLHSGPVWFRMGAEFNLYTVILIGRIYFTKLLTKSMLKELLALVNLFQFVYFVCQTVYCRKFYEVILTGCNAKTNCHLKAAILMNAYKGTDA